MAIAVVYVPIFARVIRGPVLSLREIDFVRAATSTGQSRHGVMMRHVLPNITPIVIVQVTLSLSWAVLTEAALSYLGLGAPPPAPSLGSMIFDARITGEPGAVDADLPGGGGRARGRQPEPAR